MLFINLAWIIYYFIRIQSGWIPYLAPADFFLPLIVVYIYWLIIFSFGGLYQHWFVRSRFDEFNSILKAISIGCFILFFIIFLDDSIKNVKAISRFLILIYWFLMVILVSSGRILIRSIQMNLLQRGLGWRNAFIVGDGRRAEELNSLVRKYPQLGYNILGYISLNHNSKNTKSLGDITNAPRLIEKYEVTEILIALESKEKERLLDILPYFPQDKIHLKIMPDIYEIVSGMVKTNQIYGVPLIEVVPELMSDNTKLLKRIIDIFISLSTLFFLSPLIIILALLIKLTSKGGIFYKQTRVGKNGKLFTMYKFRSMYLDSEKGGPEWASKNDPRITFIGKILRKTHFDELPQIINVLKSEMSIVGPRPERPHFVDHLKKEIPYYNKRLSVKPGITGWAQIKHRYDSSLDDVRVKLQYDFYYIENMSITLDFKIIINTFISMILLKGH